MLSPTVEEKLNEQLERELQAAYEYLAASAYCSQNNYDGVATFYFVQYQEEQTHAMKIYKYILDRGGKIQLADVRKPTKKFSSLLDSFEFALAHERGNTAGINEVMKQARSENDYATETFMQWFISEQVEEEDSFESLIERARRIEGSSSSIFMLDKELGARVFVDETANIGA